MSSSATHQSQIIKLLNLARIGTGEVDRIVEKVDAEPM